MGFTAAGALSAPESEVRLAEEVKRRFPSIDLLRFVNSGTEATMSAVRVARGFTGRDKIVMFEGAYHGHADALLVKAGSGLAATSLPGSAGVPDNAVRDTLLAHYNDLASVEGLFRSYGDQIAAVLVEPIAGNMGVVPPDPDFLEGLRRMTREFGSLLVFDEVITGFRVAPGGAQEKYGVAADVTCLGKILGHGMPPGAYGGLRDILGLVAPPGPVYQAGTLPGNPMATAAGPPTTSSPRPSRYAPLRKRRARIGTRPPESADDADMEVQVPRVGTMVGIFFRPEPVRHYRDAQAMDQTTYGRFFWALLKGRA